MRNLLLRKNETPYTLGGKCSSTKKGEGMLPRRQTSQKWTSFPKDKLDEIKDVFERNFDLKNYEVISEGRIYKEELILRIGLRSKKDSFLQYNFEASVDHDGKGKKTTRLIVDMASCAGLLLKDFLQKGHEHLPTYWYPMMNQGIKIYIQFGRSNSDLEKQADIILEEYEESSLIQGKKTQEDIDWIKKLMGVDQ